MSETGVAYYDLVSGEIHGFVDASDHQLWNLSQQPGKAVLKGVPKESTHIRAGVPIVITPAPALDEIQRQLTNAVQQHLDSTARQRNYDNMMSACTYATSTVEKFRAEGQACVAWRDQVWSTCYAALEEVLAGARPIPTADELIAELPAMIWPN